jgi:hypothetical protein
MIPGMAYRTPDLKAQRDALLVEVAMLRSKRDEEANALRAMAFRKTLAGLDAPDVQALGVILLVAVGLALMGLLVVMLSASSAPEGKVRPTPVFEQECQTSTRVDMAPASEVQAAP